jgi:hypothetical protein
MIIYVASYPRSGNSLTQNLIQTFFERPITTDDQGSRSKGSQKAKTYASGTVPFITNWRWPNGNSNPPSRWDKLQARILNNNLDRWIALYDLNVSPYTKNCRYLLPDCLRVLTPKNRQKLAVDNSQFFIKTHQPPYQEYFQGEYVIQPIRHPGAVLWSYFNLQKVYGNTTISLEKVIRNKSWSNYHRTWSQVIPSLKGRFIRLHFEDTLSNSLEVCNQISTMTNLEYNPDNTMPSFEKLNKKEPNHFRAGKVNDWEKNYTHDQMQLLDEFHGFTMQQLDYQMP